MPDDASAQILRAVSDRAFWGFFVDVATIVVIGGAALESIAEIPMATKLFRLNEGRRKKVESLGFWVLIVGLCGEFAFGIPVVNDTATIETKLGLRITDASQLADTAITNAADASNEASNALGDAQAANSLALAATNRETRLRQNLSADENALAPRIIGKREWDALASLKGKVTAVDIAYEPQSWDSFFFANQLSRPLFSVGIKVRFLRMPPGDMFVGVAPLVRPAVGQDPKTDPVMLALKRAGLGAGFEQISDVPDAAPDIDLVTVGERAPFPTKKQWYAPPRK